MIENSIVRLQYLCETIPPILSRLPEQEFALKRSPDKWSRKEILGHLIDSATNNHHRLVRAQFEESPTIGYDQNQWNWFNYYQQIDTGQVITCWTTYNKQLLALIRLISPDKLKCLVDTGGESKVTLDFLIMDYIAHMEHHLKQIVAY